MSKIPITGNDEADKLLETDPLALLHRDAARPAGADGVGVHRAVHLQQRLGELDAAQIASMDPDEFLAVARVRRRSIGSPVRWGSGCKRSHTRIVDDYDGDAGAVWRDVETGDELTPAIDRAARLRRGEDADLHRAAGEAIRCATEGVGGSRGTVRRRHATIRRRHRLAGGAGSCPSVEAGPESRGQDEGRLISSV